MMRPGVIVHENEFILDCCSVRYHKMSEDLIPISLSRQCSSPIMYRSMQPLTYIPSHTITPPPRNRTLSYIKGGLFRVPLSLQIEICLLSVCTLKQNSFVKSMLPHSSRLYPRYSSAHHLRAERPTHHVPILDTLVPTICGQNCIPVYP